MDEVLSMSTSGQQDVVLDTSVLVNFLRIGREDLLVGHPGFRFIITEHVRKEITDPSQIACLEAIIAAGSFLETSVTDVDELSLFARFSSRLGAGESAAIAVAVKRGLSLALDDRAAKRIATQELPAGALVLDTVAIVVSLIHAKVIDIAQADAMKSEWQSHHSFTLKFASFGDVV